MAAASLLLDKYGRALNVVEQDGFEPAARVYMVLEGENPVTMAKTTGIGIVECQVNNDTLIVVYDAAKVEHHVSLTKAILKNRQLSELAGTPQHRASISNLIRLSQFVIYGPKPGFVTPGARFGAFFTTFWPASCQNILSVTG